MIVTKSSSKESSYLGLSEFYKNKTTGAANGAKGWGLYSVSEFGGS